MNLAPGVPTWLAALLVLTLAAAAIEDLLRLRISNLTVLAVLLEGLAAIYLDGFSFGFWQNAVAMVCVLAVGTVAFSAGLFGGGDVKLLAALALWVNLKGLVWLLATIFLAGGIVALVYIFGRLVRSATGGQTSKDRRIPYGIAICVGALALFAMQRSEQQSADRPLLPIKIARPAT